MTRWALGETLIQRFLNIYEHLVRFTAVSYTHLDVYKRQVKEKLEKREK